MEKVLNRPVIGITADMEEGRHFLNRVYVRAVELAGAVPVVLTASSYAVQALDMLDGLLLSGGGDIHGRYFGQPLHEKAGDVNTERDEAELALTKLALARDMPIFGICRGLQLLNVARGGDLVQHMEGHKQQQARDVATHKVLLEGKLAKIMGQTEAMVNSIHHQVVDKTGTGLDICARSEDKYIEGLCARDKSFVVAVQWHPEELMTHGAQARLFEAFAAACAEYRGRAN